MRLRVKDFAVCNIVIIFAVGFGLRAAPALPSLILHINSAKLYSYPK